MKERKKWTYHLSVNMYNVTNTMGERQKRSLNSWPNNKCECTSTIRLAEYTKQSRWWREYWKWIKGNVLLGHWQTFSFPLMSGRRVLKNGTWVQLKNGCVYYFGPTCSGWTMQKCWCRWLGDLFLVSPCCSIFRSAYRGSKIGWPSIQRLVPIFFSFS